MKVKILVGYHKKGILLKNDVFVPIHLGRSLYEGKDQSEDKEWLYSNLIGDNSGENISQYNQDFCELTGIYWAWKNFSTIGNPDYVGFMHYRRWLALNGWSLPKNRNDIIAVDRSSFLRKNNKESVSQILTTGDVFTRTPLDFFETKGRESCREKGFDYIKTKYPILYNIYLEQKKKNCLYASNIFVMKREDFFKYCEILFDILNNYNSEGFPREKGYLAEFITSAYIGYLGRKYGSVTMLPIVTPYENPRLRLLMIHVYKILTLLTFGKVKQNLKKKRESLKFLY